MAWYAELKRRGWYCINGGNAIRWYKKKLYDDWYNSLTEEQKLQLEENKRKREERRWREAQEAVGRLLSMTTMMADVANRSNSKYGDLYDEYGFARHR